MENKNILILGAKDFAKIHCYYWNDKIFPNIPDFAFVILNMVSLSNSVIEESIQAKINKGLETLLKSGGNLVAIGCPEKSIETFKIYQGKRYKDYQNNYLWCPLPVKIVNESGTSFVFEDRAFEDYFKKVKKWTYYFDVGESYEDAIVGVNSLVKNRYGKYLAGRIYLAASRWQYGDFYFLPCPTEISDIDAINFILEKFCGVYQKTPPPEWTKSIEVPGLRNIQINIENNLELITQLSEENDEFKEKESELLSYRELLYETGTPLEDIIRKVFTILGYEPKPPFYKEEYVIGHEKKVGIIECKGNEKSIKRNDFRQLLDYLKEYEIDYERNHKGILIGNAWRLKPLEERDRSETPIFPNDVIRIATKQEIALVSTIDLFNVFCKFLERRIKAKDIVKKIFNAKGVVNFDK